MEANKTQVDPNQICISNFDEISLDIVTIYDGLHTIKFNDEKAFQQYKEVISFLNNWRHTHTDRYHNFFNSVNWYESRLKEIDQLCSTLVGYKINAMLSKNDKELFSKDLNQIYESVSKQRLLLLTNFYNSSLNNQYESISQSIKTINLSFIPQIPLDLNLDIKNQKNQIFEWRQSTISELNQSLDGFEVSLLELIEYIELYSYTLINLGNITLG
ncbi:hypothetical protein DDB_G0273311 [Dictyostelium discoideum AX4]|uniref:Uncharacterized protein n=1 Tax=Dictyostelium discoideum TaxID=44689 RepID=Q557D3_DICDI|nr:hypothetical protein DDB_G0273637 [Dictyostelium discoideum AX4]XP_644815.1 hypothetical protein DDB_G0273311 [Dictyostelium discoideum AX4]EAL70509.1 hypothetical protein DDB_G0273637 [Dictyostelium discoideum AX4]EAL70873.1 hypothetical protein DDB_G0273311 [Dictyostelium discoideum AX4]|eukprot:XP_644435.1 hypothetical protein DDB_G0273637 [Dictyostelium discoideum AX4]